MFDECGKSKEIDDGLTQLRNSQPLKRTTDALDPMSGTGSRMKLAGDFIEMAVNKSRSGNSPIILEKMHGSCLHPSPWN